MFDLELCQFQCTAVALLRQLRYIVLVKQTACLLRSRWWGGLELVLMCICLLMLLEHAKFVPQRSILCQHLVILCGSSDGGTEHAVGLQKFAVPEPREQVVKVHLHSEIIITVTRTHSDIKYVTK